MDKFSIKIPKHLYVCYRFDIDPILIRNSIKYKFDFEYDAYLASWSSSFLTIAGKTIFISSRKDGTLFSISLL